MTQRDVKPENVPAHDPLSIPCRICNAKPGEQCASIVHAARTLDVPHFTRRQEAKGIAP